MMLKELDGVVDSRLKIYGTKNLRVVRVNLSDGGVGKHPGDSLCGGGEGSRPYQEGLDEVVVICKCI
jgi:hypothetical protein